MNRILYILSKPAENDLDQIKEYLMKEGSIAVARKTLKKLKHAMQFFAHTPEAG